jgi:hypothetical protein
MEVRRVILDLEVMLDPYSIIHTALVGIHFKL